MFPPADPLLEEQGLTPEAPMPDQGPTLEQANDPIAELIQSLSSLPQPSAMGPAAPAMPTLPGPSGQDPKQKLIALASLAAAIAGGPRSGLAGLPRGVMAGQHQLDQQNLQRFQIESQVQARQQAMQDRQEQRIQQEQARRNGFLSSIVTSLKGVKSKKQYDQFIEYAGQQALMSGYRDFAPNELRRRFPFSAPDAAPRASAALDKWLSLPSNKKLLEGRPDVVARSTMQFDRDGDGVPESVTIEQLADLAERPFGKDPLTGKVLPAEKGTSADDKANADGILATLLERAKAEGKDVSNPAVRLALQEEAITRADKSKSDPLLDQMRRMRIEQMKRQQNVPDLSPAQFNMANRLADDFTRDSKDFVARAQAFGTVLAASKTPSPAADISLIFAFMKMIDPGSTVREGEFATAQNATGVPQQILNLYNRVMRGERLNPTQRADFVQQARQNYSSAQQRQAAIVQTYTQRATTAKVPPSLVVMDYGVGVDPDLDAFKARMGVKP